jgi:hypothetical protein
MTNYHFSMGENYRIKFGLLSILLLTASISSYSQDEDSSPFTAGADFYSSFIWRGSRYGTGPAVQPTVEYASGFFTVGAWGSFDFNGYQEADLYLSFSLPAGFTLGITDYYLPDLRYFDYSAGSGSHAFELRIGYTKNNLSLEADYIINEAGGIGSSGNDLYFQAGYSFKYFSLFMGAGNGWHTFDPDTGISNFNICNTGIEVSRTIKITDSFGIPVTGQLVFNPDKEQMFVVVGFTL